jgi:hypothetical protein
MAGQNIAAVTREEQYGKNAASRIQKSAEWRVNTAGSLLCVFDIDQNLSIIEKDQTQDILARSQDRPSSIPIEGLQLSRTRSSNNTVNIDSDKVHIVDNLDGSWDIQSTLVEVDGACLLRLMVSSRHLIFQEGAALDIVQTVKLLETIIEDARRLCDRSPVLFRMKSRAHIIRSKNTRYGIDDGRGFRTISTSAGIREMISLSAGYYDSLFANEEHQAKIRPRFLQMIVLLLSFLNEQDLQEISEFLESTYKLKSDRRHVEMVILKVLPLSSINARHFLTSLVESFGDPTLAPIASGHSPEYYAMAWDHFVRRLVDYEYILPGVIHQLGRDNASWIVKWEDNDRFRSSEVFDNIQYSGHARAINDIPTIPIQRKTSEQAVTAVLADSRRFTLYPEDVERITCMYPSDGYRIIEGGENGAISKLRIVEEEVNGTLRKAFKEINQIFITLNGYIGQAPRNQRLSFIRNPRNSRAENALLQELLLSGKLSRCIATIQDKVICVAYRWEGKTIPKNDLLRSINTDIHIARSAVQSIEKRIEDIRHWKESPRSDGTNINDRIVQLREDLNSINSLLLEAEKRRDFTETSYIDEEDEPFVQIIYPESNDLSSLTLPWQEYKIARTSQTNSDFRLQIDGQRLQVESVKWLSLDSAEIRFEGTKMAIFARPLVQVEKDDLEDQIQAKDSVILMGSLIAVIPNLDESDDGELIQNYLRITGVEEAKKTKRGMNLAKNTAASVSSIIR